MNQFRALLNRSFWDLGSIVTLVGIFFAFILGIYCLVHQVAFGWDQARDAYEAISISKGDLKIIGPSSDVPGVFHGVLWFYLLSLPYAIFNDPQVVASIFFVLVFLTVPLAGIVAQHLFKRRDVACVTMLLYAFSPLFLAFTRWLSNPVYTLWAMPFFFISLWRYLNKQTKIDALVVGISIAVVIQSEFAFGLLLIFLPIYLFVFKVKPRLNDLLIFFGGLFTFTSTYILSEIRFKGRATINMLEFILGSHSASASLDHRISVSLDKLSELVFLVFFRINSGHLLLLGVVMILLLLYKRNRIERKSFVFCLIWLCNIFIFLFFSSGFANSAFVFAPTILIFVILISYIICFVFPKVISLSLVSIFIVISTITSINWVRDEFTPLSIQRGNTVKVEKELIDYTYASSGGKPFSVSIVNNPLYIHTTWSFLYEYIGKRKHGYMPSLEGKDQSGILGNFKAVQRREGDLYLIIEPGPGIPSIYEDLGKKELDLISTLEEEKNIGNFLVQKREYKTISK